MGTKAMVFPTDETGDLYAIYDENGNQIGGGSRDTCYFLLKMINRKAEESANANKQGKGNPSAGGNPNRNEAQR